MSIIKHNLDQELFEDLTELSKPSIREINRRYRNKKLRDKVKKLKEQDKINLYGLLLAGMKDKIAKVEQDANKEREKREKR